MEVHSWGEGRSILVHVHMHWRPQWLGSNTTGNCLIEGRHSRPRARKKCLEVYQTVFHQGGVVTSGYETSWLTALCCLEVSLDCSVYTKLSTAMTALDLAYYIYTTSHNYCCFLLYACLHASIIIPNLGIDYRGQSSWMHVYTLIPINAKTKHCFTS